MTPPKGPYSSTSSKKDNINRLSKKRNPLGIATFVGLRALDPLLQYGILARGIGSALIQKLGGTALPPGPALVTRTVLDSVVGLSPYRTILLAMSTASMLKQNATLLAIMQEETTVPLALMIAGFNTIFNSLNSFLFITAQTSPSAGELFPQKPLIVGTTLFVVGMGIEVVSEAQRTVWKKKPENKGKVYTGGLFSLSRHVNYFGYLLWRSGYALAGGGWTWAGTLAAFFWYDFTQRAIPVLQHYLEEKYGEAYEEYERTVPYRFFPFVY